MVKIKRHRIALAGRDNRRQIVKDPVLAHTFVVEGRQDEGAGKTERAGKSGKLDRIGERSRTGPDHRVGFDRDGRLPHA